MSLLSASKALILLGITSSANAQRRFRQPVEFIGDSLDKGEIAVWGLLLLISLAQCFLTFIGLIIVRGHRLPYAALFSMLFAFIVAAAATLVGRVLTNLFPIDVARHTFSTLDGLTQFFGNWSQVLLFVSIVLAMHDRINSIDTGSGKTPLKNDTNIRLTFWAVHGLFVLLTFVFGTAAAAMIVSLDRDFESDNIGLLSEAALVRKANAADGLYYTFASFIIFTAFDVMALAVYLRNRLTKASVKDKVSSSLIYFVTPCYILLTILFMAFLILFSPAGIKDRSTDNLTGIRIANALTTNIVQIILISPIILYGFSRMRWGNPGENYASNYAVYANAPGPGQQAPYVQQGYNNGPYYPPQWPAPVQGQPMQVPAPQAPPGQISQPQVPQAQVQ